MHATTVMETQTLTLIMNDNYTKTQLNICCNLVSGQHGQVKMDHTYYTTQIREMLNQTLL